MPNQQVSNQPAEDLKVTIYGDPSMNAALIDSSGRLLITGLISLTSSTPVNITGLTIQTAVISNTISISIPGTISVSLVNNPLSVQGSLSLSGSPTFILGGLSFIQQITTIPVNASLIALGSLKMPIIDVGSLTKYGYFVQTPGSLLQAINVVQQISYTTQDSSFISAPEGIITIAIGGSRAITGKYMRYSRLEIAGLGVVGNSGNITVIFQGQV